MILLRPTLLALAAGLFLGPVAASAQEIDPPPSDGGMRMLRVYMSEPYHFDVVIKPRNDDLTRFTIYIDGKEVGSADVEIDCQARAWSQTVTQPFTGASARYVDTVIDLFLDDVCGAAPE